MKHTVVLTPRQFFDIEVVIVLQGHDPIGGPEDEVLLVRQYERGKKINNLPISFRVSQSRITDLLFDLKKRQFVKISFSSSSGLTENES